jgi:hypothetical protein
MKHLQIILAVFSSIFCNAQSNWKITSDWKIYSVADRLIFKVPVDSLLNIKHRQLDNDSIQHYLAVATRMKDSVQPIWMGGFLLSYQYEGQAYEIQLSVYGGFFFDHRLNYYYEVPKSISIHLLTYINRKIDSP